MEAWKQLQAIINRLLPIAFDRGISAPSPPERSVFLVWSYPAAINDGGHASFFYNSYGERAHETVQALIEVGASEYAAILSRAIDLFPSHRVPRNFEERNSVFDSLTDEAHRIMEGLDKEFFALGGNELWERAVRYWNNHPG